MAVEAGQDTLHRRVCVSHTVVGFEERAFADHEQIEIKNNIFLRGIEVRPTPKGWRQSPQWA